PAVGRRGREGAVRRQHEAEQRRGAAGPDRRGWRLDRRCQPGGRRPARHDPRDAARRARRDRGGYEMTVTAPTKTHVDTALENVRSAMSEHEVDALLVTYPPNVRYLTGFSSPEDA